MFSRKSIWDNCKFQFVHCQFNWPILQISKKFILHNSSLKCWSETSAAWSWLILKQFQMTFAFSNNSFLCLIRGAIATGKLVLYFQFLSEFWMSLLKALSKQGRPCLSWLLPLPQGGTRYNPGVEGCSLKIWVGCCPDPIHCIVYLGGRRGWAFQEGEAVPWGSNPSLSNTIFYPDTAPFMYLKKIATFYRLLYSSL